ncbi:MAG: hypothetical protein ACI89X_001710 [Planctomycetota bacterium]|jgi:hypothetical protein
MGLGLAGFYFAMWRPLATGVQTHTGYWDYFTREDNPFSFWLSVSGAGLSSALIVLIGARRVMGKDGLD